MTTGKGVPTLPPLTVALTPAGLQEIEPVIRQAAKMSGLTERSLERFVFAVNEVAEAAVTLAQSLQVEGVLRLVATPFTSWVAASISFPKEIPLDPVFDPEDAILAEFPAVGVMPDIFWRRIVRQWVDKAQWAQEGRETTITLSQYRRLPGQTSELYFLGLVPRPVPGLKVDLLGDDLALAVAGATRSAFHLAPQAAFILQSIDGRTAIREIYRAMIRRFGLLHPRLVGRMVEELIRKGLIIPGEAVIRPSAGLWGVVKRTVRYLFSLQYAFTRPDPFFTRLNRLAGPLWGRPGLLLAFALLAGGLLTGLPKVLAAPGTLQQALETVSNRPGGWLGLYAGLTLFILLHEFAHAMVCKRAGGHIHAFGAMFYYGLLCFFVDTTDSWRFRQGQRVLVSLAGPLTDLTLCGAFLLLYGLAPAGAATVRGVALVLAVLAGVSSLMNLNPFLETDGYYILQDALNLVNLRPRALASLPAACSAFRQGLKEGLRFLRSQTGLVCFGLLSAVTTGLLLAWSGYLVFFGAGLPVVFKAVIFAFTALSLFNQFLQAALRRFRRARMVEIDLNPM